VKKRWFLFPALIAALALPSDAAIGVKAGLNYSNVTGASSINPSSRSGYMVGVFFGPPPMGLMSFRTEFVLSRQGYDFNAGAETGSVSLDYLLMPALMGINLGKIAQIQLGGQVAYLLNAKVNGAGTGDPAMDKIMDFYNRFDYGLAGGVEFTPVKALLVGVRINISLAKLYKDPASLSGGTPSFFPSIDAKNNVVQLYAGFQF
jgi:hypothetical protein